VPTSTEHPIQPKAETTMATTAGTDFPGFSHAALQFLVDLAANNERSWFQPRKSDYERLLKEPLEALCAALGERFEALGVPLSADRRSPFRIYRDVRFSHDKSPYKTNVAASFPWADTDGNSGVGGYFHLSPGEAYVGAGMWHPEPARLAAFRAAVVADPVAIRGLLSTAEFTSTFGEVGGDRLKRMPSGFPPDHPEAELLKLKDVTFGQALSDDEVERTDLPDRIVRTLAAATPVLRFLATLPA
jgi:uncharacterized protein (TIGR02453 family)